MNLFTASISSGSNLLYDWYRSACVTTTLFTGALASFIDEGVACDELQVGRLLLADDDID